jgi:predicted ABC-type ATPase
VTDAPRLTIVGGPNGAGKSTLTRTAGLRGHLIDPDAIAKLINAADPESASLSAGREALRRSNDYISKRLDFVQESTLSGGSALRLIGKAKAAGYEVDLRYIGVPASEVSQARVAERVASGGHNIPVADIDRRYGRSMTALPAVLALVDTATIYDNAGDQQHRIVAEVRRGTAVFRAPERPKWVDMALSGIPKADRI